MINSPIDPKDKKNTFDALEFLDDIRVLFTPIILFLVIASCVRAFIPTVTTFAEKTASSTYASEQPHSEEVIDTNDQYITREEFDRYVTNNTSVDILQSLAILFSSRR